MVEGRVLDEAVLELDARVAVAVERGQLDDRDEEADADGVQSGEDVPGAVVDEERDEADEQADDRRQRPADARVAVPGRHLDQVRHIHDFVRSRRVGRCVERRVVHAPGPWMRARETTSGPRAAREEGLWQFQAGPGLALR